MKIGIKQSIPAGVYDAIFEGIEQTEHPEYGDGLCWSWTITRGQYKGQQVFRTTKTVGTTKNSCGKFLVALTGEPLDVAATRDVDEYEGVACSVVVEQTETSSRVSTFIVKRDDEGGAA